MNTAEYSPRPVTAAIRHVSPTVAALALASIGMPATVLLPGSVKAQTATSTERACDDVPMRPASVTAYFRALFEGGTPLPRPTGNLQAYQAATAAAKATDWAGLCRYRADDRRLMALPASERRVVYIGDSITEGWGLVDAAFFSRGRVNRGISGQTTGQLLVRFEADVIALHPRVVHILAGTNDLAGNEGPETLDDIRNNIAAMATLAKANGIRVVLASITPAARYPWKPGIAPVPQIRALNAWLAHYAASVGATYVDYYSVLVGVGGGMRPDLTFDGVHLNRAGYTRIRAISEAATAR